MKMRYTAITVGLLAFSALSACVEEPVRVSPSPVTPASSTSPEAVSTPKPEVTAYPSSFRTPGPPYDLTPKLPVQYFYVDTTTLNGKIYDDEHAPLDGAVIKAESLNRSIPYDFETVSAGGHYVLNRVPCGTQIEITVSKPGWTKRKRTEVLKVNKDGIPDFNRYDFGNDGINKQYSADYYALSDKPEVILSTPARNGSNINPLTSFILKFSEPMDRKSVEDTFSVYSFNARKLSVDAGNPSRTQTLKGNANLSTNFLPGNSTLIWDKDAFNISWNSDDTEVTFSFSKNLQLPTDRNRQNLPDYNLAFYNSSTGNHTLKDKQGNSRSDKHFKLTEGEFEESLSFSIQTDEKAPELRSLKAETAENGSGQGDLLRVRYSEPMIFYLRELPIAGGMENISGAELKAPAAYPGSSVVTGLTTALNYSTTITQTGGTTRYAGPWGALGGTAIYDSTDPTHHTVLLLPPSYTQPTLAHVWLTGSTLLTAAGDYHSDGNANTAGVFTLLRSQSLAPVDLSFNLNSNLATAQALAADLQNALNTAAAAANPPASAQAFQVSAEASGQLKIQFNDSNGNYVGFAVKTDVTGQATDQLPVLRTGGQTLQNGSLLDLLQPGDKVQLKVRESVSDPAGNTLDSQRSTVSGNAG